MGVQFRRVGQKAGQMKFSLVCSGVLIAICMIDNTRSRFFRCFCPTVSDLVKYMDEAAARKEIRSCKEYCRAEREESDKKAQRLVTTRKLRCKAGDIIFCSKPEYPVNTPGNRWKNRRECPEYEAFWEEFNARLRKTDLIDDDEYAKLENFVSEAAKGRGSREIQCNYYVM